MYVRKVQKVPFLQGQNQDLKKYRGKNTKEFLNGLANIKTIFKNKDGTIIQEEMSSNLMGNPINVLKWLINDFNEKGKILKANDRISLGSIGKLYPLKANETYIYTFDGLDKISSVSINTN